MIQLGKILKEQGKKKWPPTGLDEKGAKAFITWMQRQRPSAYEAIGLSITLAANPEDDRIREAYSKFGTAWFKTDPDAKYNADPNANDQPQSDSNDDWGWIAWIIIGVLSIGLIGGLNRFLGWTWGTESGRLISTRMFKSYKNSALKQKISLIQYLEAISGKQDIWIKNKQGDLIKLTAEEKATIEKALKNPAVRKMMITETTEWGVEQLKKGSITAEELSIMVSADEATYTMFKRIENSSKKSYSKLTPKRTTVVKTVNPAGRTGKMLNSDIAKEKLIYKKEHSISLTQFEQAAKGQIPSADMAKTYSSIAPKGKLNVNMPSSILRLQTFPTKESWVKHYNAAKIPVPTAKDAYIKDKIRFNFLRN